MTNPTYPVSLTREELYAKIWSTPQSVLCKEFRISDTGLTKICKRLDVPVPPRGYWAKRQAGKPTIKYQLPPRKADIPENVVIRPTPEPTPPPPLPEAVVSKVSEAAERAASIKVPKSLANAHPLVRSWIDADRKREAADRWSPYHFKRQRIDGNPLERRRLRILSALFKAWDRLGHKIIGEVGRPYQTAFEFEGVKIAFSLRERERQYRRPLTQEEKNDAFRKDSKWRQVREATGELLFEIKEYFGGSRLKWKDKDHHPLEDQLNDIVQGLVTAGAILAERHRKHEEEERRRRIEEHKRYERKQARQREAARWQHFLRLFEASRRSKEILAFIDEFERINQDDNTDEASMPEVVEWLAWARQRARDIDPLNYRIKGLMEINRNIQAWGMNDVEEEIMIAARDATRDREAEC